MEYGELILLGIAAVIVIAIFAKLLKTIFRVAVVVAVLFGVYWFWSGGNFGQMTESKIESMLQNTTITELMNTHCTESKKESVRCKCIITPVYNDMNYNYSKRDIEQMEATNRDEMARIMMSSFKTKKPEIMECVNQKKEGALQWVGKIKDIIGSLVGLIG